MASLGGGELWCGSNSRPSCWPPWTFSSCVLCMTVTLRNAILFRALHANIRIRITCVSAMLTNVRPSLCIRIPCIYINRNAFNRRETAPITTQRMSPQALVFILCVRVAVFIHNLNAATVLIGSMHYSWEVTFSMWTQDVILSMSEGFVIVSEVRPPRLFHASCCSDVTILRCIWLPSAFDGGGRLISMPVYTALCSLHTQLWCCSSSLLIGSAFLHHR